MDFFQLDSRIYSGVGSSKVISDIISKDQAKSVLIYVDQGVFDYNPYYKEFLQWINDSATKCHEIVLRGNEEPDYEYVDELAAQIREIDNIDLIIGIGGGSTMDITKILAVLKTNPGESRKYRGFDQAVNPGIKTVLIPTTAGTGSEVTNNAPVIDKKVKMKMGINGRYLNATYAVLDAEWLMSLPKKAAVGAGMDALLHAVESFSCLKANVFTQAAAKEAFRLLFNNIISLTEDKENKNQKQNLLIGSSLAGISLFNSGSGAAHIMSYPLGAHYGVPHGIGGGLFLGEVIDFNVKNGYRGYSALYDLIENSPEMSEEDKNIKFVEKMKGLNQLLNMPENLKDWNLKKDDINHLLDLMNEVKGGFANNPVLFDPIKDAEPILEKYIK